VLGRITRGRHTDNLGGRHSIQTNQQSTSINPSPIFMSDALPATTLPIYPGLGQAQEYAGLHTSVTWSTYKGMPKLKPSHTRNWRTSSRNTASLTAEHIYRHANDQQLHYDHHDITTLDPRLTYLSWSHSRRGWVFQGQPSEIFRGFLQTTKHSRHLTNSIEGNSRH